MFGPEVLVGDGRGGEPEIDQVSIAQRRRLVPRPAAWTFCEHLSRTVDDHFGQALVIEQAPQRFEVTLEHARFGRHRGRLSPARRGDREGGYEVGGHGLVTRGEVRWIAAPRLSTRRKSYTLEKSRSRATKIATRSPWFLVNVGAMLID